MYKINKNIVQKKQQQKTYHCYITTTVAIEVEDITNLVRSLIWPQHDLDPWFRCMVCSC